MTGVDHDQDPRPERDRDSHDHQRTDEDQRRRQLGRRPRAVADGIHGVSVPVEGSRPHQEKCTVELVTSTHDGGTTVGPRCVTPASHRPPARTGGDHGSRHDDPARARPGDLGTIDRTQPPLPARRVRGRARGPDRDRLRSRTRQLDDRLLAGPDRVPRSRRAPAQRSSSGPPPHTGPAANPTT